MVTACWHWASGLSAPLRRALTAAAAICSSVAPRSAMNWLGPRGVQPHEDAARRVAAARPGGRACRPGSRPGSPTSIAASVAGPVAGPHLLDPDDEHRAGPGARARVVPEVQGRGAAGARVVDVHDRDVAQGRLAQPGLAADAALVVQAAAAGVRRRRRGRARPAPTPASARALVDHLEGHLLGGQVAPAHVGHAGAEDVDGGSCSWGGSKTCG